MIFGYINETRDYSLQVQTDCLRPMVSEIVIEAKGKKISSEKFISLLERIREGDTLKVFSIYALPLTTLELIKIIDQLSAKKISFVSASENLGDREIFSTLAHHARLTRKNRSLDGLASAKARGRNGGRKAGLTAEAENTAQAAAQLYNSKMNIEDILSTLKISKATLYRYLRFAGVDIKGFTKSK